MPRPRTPSDARHACDPQRPGDVILGVHREDGIGRELLSRGREQRLPGLEVVEEAENLNDVVEQLTAEGPERGLSVDESEQGLRADSDLHFTLLRVPEGDEQAAAASLLRLRLTIALEEEQAAHAPQVIAQPNRYLDFDATSGSAALTPDHLRYLQVLGLAGASRIRTVAHPHVRVIDTGSGGLPNVVRRVNLLDRNADVSDHVGHGSAVTAIIDDCTSGRAAFEVFKVADAARKPTEWEVLLALSLGPMPPIVNLSLSLGFGRVACRTCGRQPVGARTGVFEERLRELEQAGVVVVAAAGNRPEPELRYPSRFSSVVAVKAWYGDPPQLAPYSNQGVRDHAGGPHPNVFVCPGGYTDAGEGPAVDGAGHTVDGTSYATAYMTGLLAATWARRSVCDGGCWRCREGVLDLLRRAADPGALSPATAGHGLAMLPS